jgi:tetratricopeptide (TPR) repeat protein
MRKRAAELDPLTPERKSNIGLVHYFARQYDAAAQQYLELTHSDPDLPGPHARLFDIYSRTGKEFEAIAELEKSLALQGADNWPQRCPKNTSLRDLKEQKLCPPGADKNPD